MGYFIKILSKIIIISTSSSNYNSKLLLLLIVFKEYNYNYLLFAWFILVTVKLINDYGVGHIHHLYILKKNVFCISTSSLFFLNYKQLKKILKCYIISINNIYYIELLKLKKFLNMKMF